jgi:hypothetical protein
VKQRCGLTKVMPCRLFHSSQYDADTIRLVSEIFDEVCTELGLANREDELRDLIAHEIIECVRKGQRDPEHVWECARRPLNLLGTTCRCVAWNLGAAMSAAGESTMSVGLSVS